MARRKGMAMALSPLSSEDLRTVFRTVSDVLAAMSDGRVVVDGQPFLSNASQPAGDRRYTVKEIRAQAQLRSKSTNPPEKKRTARKRVLPARRAYTLANSDGGKLDLSGLTDGAVGLVRYLSVHDKPTMKELVKELGLKRSTIGNMLTTLRKRKLIESVSVSAAEVQT